MNNILTLISDLYGQIVTLQSVVDELTQELEKTKNEK